MNAIKSASRNLLQTAAANGQFSTFTRLVESAGLTATLDGEGPFTVFAPTDAAFGQLPLAKLDSLSKPENRDELVSILNYHVLKGRRSAADIAKWDVARTVNGQPAPIAMADGKMTVDGAVVVNADIDSANGVIHGIDKVNLPKAKVH
ncbi:MAG: fasciclin domain-containing protein [Xanthomonadaceae bacterium]|jgi:uncharacterized surface protein with fasciclin (FAS1) repeats|nr:fasciclin domain-containing protein [Xanthomonadaceae bacterium]